MDVYDIRQRQLRALMREQFKGVQRELAEAVGRDPNYLSRVLSTGPNRKKIGEEFAREIEKRLQLSTGFLDRDSVGQPVPLRVIDREPPLPVSHTAHGVLVSREGAEIGAEWDKIEGDEYRHLARDFIYGLVAAQKRAARLPAPRLSTRAKPAKNKHRPHASE